MRHRNRNNTYLLKPESFELNGYSLEGKCWNFFKPKQTRKMMKNEIYQIISTALCMTDELIRWRNNETQKGEQEIPPVKWAYDAEPTNRPSREGSYRWRPVSLALDRKHRASVGRLLDDQDVRQSNSVRLIGTDQLHLETSSARPSSSLDWVSV